MKVLSSPAILLHYMLGYDHPFVDGNGRTARALFYWSLARSGYWLMEYVSISRLLKQARRSTAAPTSTAKRTTTTRPTPPARGHGARVSARLGLTQIKNRFKAAC